ncbi:hypothetical protein M8J77_017427 [Diaphorina citri]|nr:hypothetical protein M8J77_017427 [Diaphorina citri]
MNQVRQSRITSSLPTTTNDIPGQSPFDKHKKLKHTQKISRPPSTQNANASPGGYREESKTFQAIDPALSLFNEHCS